MDSLRQFPFRDIISTFGITKHTKYTAASSTDMEEEHDSRTSSSSESTAREENGLLRSTLDEKPQQSTRFQRLLISLFSTPKLRMLLAIIFASTSAISIMYLADHIPTGVSTHTTHHQSSKSPNKVLAFEKPCGNTVEEARARGCHFDVMAFMWLPKQCYDQELIDDFLALHEWRYYEDKNLSMPVTLGQAMTGGYALLYVSHEYHVRHCTLLWRKMHRALLSPLGLAAVDGYMASYAHTLHCEHMLLDWRDRPFGLINTGLVRQFPSCGMFAR